MKARCGSPREERGLRAAVTVGIPLAGLLLLASCVNELVRQERSLPAQVPLRNPHTGRPEAIAEGRQLFLDAGCHKCHSRGATGGKGPNLTDEEWLISGTDEVLFRTIMKGRPKKGKPKSEAEMPSWEDALETEQVWKIIAWIRSVYRGDPAKAVWEAPTPVELLARITHPAIADLQSP